MEVSFIIPAFNAGKYLGCCLDSILLQSVEKEIIVVDDGSSDNTLQVAQDYASRFSEIKVYSQQNKGQGAARNVGMDKACGRFLFFVDSDDYLLSDFIPDFVREADRFGADIVLGYYARCYEDHVEESRVDVPFNGKVVASQEFLAQSLKNNCIKAIACNMLIRRNMVEEIRFPEGIFYEDMVFYFDLFSARKDLRILQLDEITYGYRFVKTSTTAQKKTFHHFESYVKAISLVKSMIDRRDTVCNDFAMSFLAQQINNSIGVFAMLGKSDRQKSMKMIDRTLIRCASNYSASKLIKAKLISFSFSPGLISVVYRFLLSIRSKGR